MASPNPLKMVRGGLAKPGEVLPFVRLKAEERLYRFRARDRPRQRERIAEFVDRERFLLVVLDACRFDAFRDGYREHLDGDVERVVSVAGNTPNYLRRTWTGEYDLTYVSANPQVTDEADRLQGMDYRPTEHLREIIDVWAEFWDHETGTTPPEPVTRVALDHLEATDDERMVVHYMQPHSPFVGDDPTLNAREMDPRHGVVESTPGREGHWSEVADERGPKSIQESDAVRPTEYVQQLYDRGEITGEDLRRAYRSNLERVLRAVRELVVRVDPSVPVVVTADHGEMLGDVPFYGFAHPDTMHPAVRDVPWFRVDERIQGTVETAYEPGTEVAGEPNEELTVADRLRSLGYLQDG